MTRIELLQQSKGEWIQYADQQIGLAAMYRKHGDPGEEAHARGRAMKAYARADLRQASIDKLLAQSRNKTLTPRQRGKSLSTVGKQSKQESTAIS